MFNKTNKISSAEAERLRRRAMAQRTETIELLYHRYEGAPVISSLTRRRWRHQLQRVLARGRRLGTAAIRRGVDLTVSGTALAALGPLMGGVALAIKCTDGGPVLYWQTRVGRHGETFSFPKFRSMVVDAERLRDEIDLLNQHGDGITFKVRHDPRVTWIGRLIRRTSVDELPQLVSVLLGDMSLVGPRPPLPSEVERYSVQDRRRLEARPGITCIWQVSGRSEIPFEQQVELDVQYIEERSLGRDLRLLLDTLPAVISGKGAY